MKVELIEKAAEIVGDNQLLINIVSRRVQQLSHGSDPYVQNTPDMGYGDIALTEIIQGKITWRPMTPEEEEAGGPIPIIEEPLSEVEPTPEGENFEA